MSALSRVRQALRTRRTTSTTPGRRSQWALLAPVAYKALRTLRARRRPR